MSTLDDLKKQASDVTQRNQVVTPAPSGATEKEHWRNLAPVMKYLQDHFTELANTLNVLEKATLVDFKINESVTLKGLKGENYKITHPIEDKEKDFILEFENIGEHPTYASVPVGSPATTFKNTLNNNQIKCVTTPLDKTKSIRFEIKPRVRTKYQFTADLEKGNISLTITNYSNLWAQTNYFKKNDISSELMDELTKHVLREPNKYDEMVGNVISEEERTMIRENLKANITAKNAQAAKNETQATKTQQPAKKEKSLLGKFFKKK